ncbi:MAG: hypothetical protein ABSH50_06280 [Bryobacteraceae bacterium]|jgi:hypothetical protein
MRRWLMALAMAAGAQAAQVTWTGWFADEQCATARAESGQFGPTNPECAKTCIQDGKAAAFISEQAKAVFKVEGYSGVIADLGYHVQITADVDNGKQTVAIRSVKRLGYENLSCERPRKK